jgi:hypothetical protein
MTRTINQGNKFLIDIRFDRHLVNLLGIEFPVPVPTSCLSIEEGSVTGVCIRKGLRCWSERPSDEMAQELSPRRTGKMTMMMYRVSHVKGSTGESHD